VLRIVVGTRVVRDAVADAHCRVAADTRVAAAGCATDAPEVISL